MKKTWAAIALLMIMVATGCFPPAASPIPTEPPPTATPVPAPEPAAAPAPGPATPAEVVMGTAERYNAGDLDGTMAYWADDATFIMVGMPPTGIELARGKEQIREVFAENIANHSQWEVAVELVSKDTVHTVSKNWHDATRQLGVAPLEASGVYLIRDGKIAEYTWVLTEDSAERLATALAAAMPAEPEGTVPAATPMSAITVTIADGTCRYDGPLALQAGMVEVTVDAQDQDKQAFGVGLFTLAPDKDFMDLMASTTRSVPPPWSKMFSFTEVRPGERESYTVRAEEGPVYVVCFAKPPELPIGNAGPFEVSQ